MGIDELLTEDLVCENLKGKNKYEVIEELLDLLVKNDKIVSRESCLKDLFEREQYLSTGLEKGLAVPHAKSSAVKELLVSFGLSRDGLDFQSLDGKPAYFIFLVLSPRDTSSPHIKILAQITRNFREGDLGQRILAAPGRKEIFEIIKNFK